MHTYEGGVDGVEEVHDLLHGTLPFLGAKEPKARGSEGAAVRLHDELEPFCLVLVALKVLLVEGKWEGRVRVMLWWRRRE